MSSPSHPRLCQLKKWDHFDGYGFNLHAEKNKPGQYIGKIDPGSPAEAAGLKSGDKIIEVNGVNVNQENHKQVVQRIKGYPNHTTLLVVDKECEQHHKNTGVVIRSSLPYVLSLSSEAERVTEDHEEEEVEEVEEEEDIIDTRLQTVSFEDKLEMFEGYETVKREDSALSSKSTASDKSESSGVSSARSTPVDGMSEQAEEENIRTEIQLSKKDELKLETGTLNLNMTAKQMRELVQQRKKWDPRTTEKVDLWKKYQIVQAL